MSDQFSNPVPDGPEILFLIDFSTTTMTTSSNPTGFLRANFLHVHLRMYVTVSLLLHLLLFNAGYPLTDHEFTITGHSTCTPNSSSGAVFTHTRRSYRFNLPFVSVFVLIKHRVPIDTRISVMFGDSRRLYARR